MLRKILQEIVELCGHLAYWNLGCQLDAPAPYFRPNCLSDEDLPARLHDAMACSGTDEDLEIAGDLYQKQAQQDPCPVCEAIREVLKGTHENSLV